MYFFYFYPLGLDRKRERRPVLSWVMMVLMVVTFLWMRTFPQRGPVDPYELIFFVGSGKPWTAMTAVFLHGGWLHLLGNLLYFHVFGPPLEDRLGPARFFMYFMMMGVFGNLVHGLVTSMGWLGSPGVGVLGASGGIAGLLSFSLIRFYDARIAVAWWVLAPLAGQNKAGRSYLPMFAAVGLWLLLQVVQAVAATESGANVSFGAHLGGFSMGLVLALGLGQFGAAKLEALQGRAERYFRDGHFHAAAGTWTEYLERAPRCLTGRRGMARAQRSCGQFNDSRSHYLTLYKHLVALNRVDEALEVFAEATRGQDLAQFGPEVLTRVAYYREKQMDYTGALAAYKRLYEAYGQRQDGQRALVRVIVLYHGKIADPAAARHWLDIAARQLPPGSWRRYLEQEFNLATDPGATSEATAGDTVPRPVS